MNDKGFRPKADSRRRGCGRLGVGMHGEREEPLAARQNGTRLCRSGRAQEDHDGPRVEARDGLR